MRDDDASVRMQALRLLDGMKEAELSVLLSEAWKDEDPEVRLTAVRVAVRHRTSGARLMCLEALNDTNPAVRIAGLVGVEHASYAVQRPRIQRMVEDPHGEVSWHASRLLAKHRNWQSCSDQCVEGHVVSHPK